MYSLIRKISITVIGIGFVIGCKSSPDSRVSSSQVYTGQIFSLFHVISEGGDNVFIEAQLTQGIPATVENENDVFIRLSAGDALWASTGESFEELDLGGDDIFASLDALHDTQIELEPGSAAIGHGYSFFGTQIYASEIWYSARMPQTDEGRYRISLFREDDLLADASTVTLPSAFSVSHAAVGGTYSRSLDDIDITWTNVEADVSVEVETNVICPGGGFDSDRVLLSADEGAYTISAGTFDSPLLEGRCSATVNIRKVRLGEFDSAFTGGYMLGYQVRKLSFSTME